ncbi:long-chain fatty acid--CoA ligase [Actinospica sp. MGRD01-02]|uniref:Long-chain fatty acid--CoA ligase n=1 Tax=Actinospica acidithermotolerans TaxID=2828514 RepID=A0A941ECB9_9ACTN|nr:long-chain fatty acid--CoA ligase [Actinospica acidithermotolerans]MBR7827838.1 long-chain fatty acid--CoA ligase [Actinospica acidithermotolerans]
MSSPEANLAAILTTSAARHPGHAAIKLDEQVLSYAQLDAASSRVAAFLSSRGIEPGSQVGLMLPNVPEFAVLYYGILRAGGVVVPMNLLLKAREVAYHLADAQSAGVLCWHTVTTEAAEGAARAGVPCVVIDPEAFATELAGHPPAPALTPRDPSDTAVILYTSGTTGRPKGAELTHDNLSRNAEVTVRTLLECGPDDKLFGGLPLFHSFGQTVALNCAIASGACLSLIARFDAGKALEVIERDRVTVFLGVPTMYMSLLAHDRRAQHDLSSLRVCVSGGAALPVEVLHGFEEAFDTIILEGYGLSETSPVACFNHPGRVRKPGTIGTPIEAVDMRIVDADGREVPDGQVGEIEIRGHNVMKGYWRRPDATLGALSNGWLRTGDVGVRDDEGYFRIVDRKKDMIIRGGFNVYPREIEEVLYEHPDVAEAAVIGIPHPTHGEEVAAAVALRPGATATAADLREHVKALVAPYKYPRHVWILQTLPKGPTGKILKREIQPPADQPA